MLPFGDQGVVIVNVKVKALLNVVDQMINKDITFMNITSDAKEQVYPRAANLNGARLRCSGFTGESGNRLLLLLYRSGILAAGLRQEDF